MPLMEPAAVEQLARFDSNYWWFKVRYRLALSLLGRDRVATAPILLDYGCGGGGFLRFLLAQGIDRQSVLGMDPDPGNCAFLRASGIPHVQLDAIRPVRDQVPARPTAITILDVLEHVQDPRDSLHSLFEAADNGARLVVLVPAFEWLWSEWDDYWKHLRRYTRRTLAADVSAAGWRVLETRYFFAALVAPVTLRASLIRRRRLSRSEFPPVPGWLNRLLGAYFTMESRVPCLPFGTSVAVVAEKR